MGLCKRRHYKPERAPARAKGLLGSNAAPLSVPDASAHEVLMSLSAVALEAGLRIGRGGDYDRIADRYTVVGKSLFDGKAMDVKINGEIVGEIIIACRMMRNGTMDPKTGSLIAVDSGIVLA
jgi:hypothetical protein